MSSFTGSQKKRKNREQLRDLGHTTTASAIAEIKTKIPTFNVTSGYPKMNGVHPPLAVLVLFARGAVDLTFDGPNWRPPVVRQDRNSRRSCGGRGGDFTESIEERSFSDVW